MLRTSFFIAKIKKERNSVNTSDRVIVLAFSNSLHGPLSAYQVSFIYLQYFSDMLWTSLLLQQEAHGPRFAHLSDIATADMQMLCNIFPILSSQLMKISSFEQFLVLKKNIWA